MNARLLFKPRGFACSTAYDAIRIIKRLLAIQGSLWEDRKHTILEKIRRAQPTPTKSKDIVPLTIFGNEIFRTSSLQLGVVRLPETYSVRYGVMFSNGATDAALLESEAKLQHQLSIPRGYSDITLSLPFQQEAHDNEVILPISDVAIVLRALNLYAQTETDGTIKERSGFDLALLLEKESQRFLGGACMLLYPAMNDGGRFTLQFEYGDTSVSNVSWATSKIIANLESGRIVLPINPEASVPREICLSFSFVSGLRVRENEYLPVFNLARANSVIALLSEFAH